VRPKLAISYTAAPALSIDKKPDCSDQKNRSLIGASSPFKDISI
jgi:hypothetical protein